MRQLFHKLISSVYPSLIWTAIILFLLCLPGSMLPEESTFSISNFDKLVHAGLFGGFVVVWCFYLAERFPASLLPLSLAFRLFITSCLFGIALEYVQKYWIPGRDFDPWDMVADSTGALLGWFFILIDRSRRIKMQKAA